MEENTTSHWAVISEWFRPVDFNEIWINELGNGYTIVFYTYYTFKNGFSIRVVLSLLSVENDIL